MAKNLSGLLPLMHPGIRSGLLADDLHTNPKISGAARKAYLQQVEDSNPNSDLNRMHIGTLTIFFSYNGHYRAR